MSIRDVAKASQAPISAVSLILNGKPHTYSKATEERVRSMAQKMGYRPRAYAQSMRTGKFNQITYVASGVPGYQVALQLGLHDAIKEKGYRMEYAFLDSRNVDENDIRNQLGSIASDGLILNVHNPVYPVARDYLAQSQFPHIFLNVDFEWNAVHLKDKEASRWAVEQLIEAGHKRIWYFEGESLPNGHISEAERRAGYLEAMMAADLMPKIINIPYREHDSESLGRLEAILGADFWSSPNRPTALVCYTFITCWHLMLSAHDHGLKVFKDFITVAFGEKPTVDLIGIPLPYMKIPFREMGFAGVDLLTSMLESGDHRIPSVGIEHVPWYFDRIGESAS